jgi:hypothetical protein
MNSNVERPITTSPFFKFFLCPFEQSWNCKCKCGCFYQNFLSIPIPYWDCWMIPAALGLLGMILFFCLTGDAFQMTASVFRGGSHQHLAQVVHHHPTIISQWLPQSNTTLSNGLSTLSGTKELWIFGYDDKYQDLSSLVVAEILNMEYENGSLDYGISYECRSLLIKVLHNLIERSFWKFSPLFVIKWFLPTISNECTGVYCQVILSGLGKWCSHRKDSGFCLHTTTKAKLGTGFFHLYNHYSNQEQSFSFSSTESRLFPSVSTSVNIQSYARPPTVI